LGGRKSCASCSIFLNNRYANYYEGNESHKVEDRPALIRVSDQSEGNSVRAFQKKGDRKKQKESISRVFPEPKEEDPDGYRSHRNGS
jgi:hypothetical protein